MHLLRDYIYQRELGQVLGARIGLVTRKHDGKAFIAKQSIGNGARYSIATERELSFLRQIDDPAFLRPQELVREPSPGILILEYVYGLPLREAFARLPIDPVAAIEVAIALCETLGALHRQGAVYGTLSPARIWMEPGRRSLRIIDLAPIFVGETHLLEHDDPEILRDLLPYISPEYTGRTGRRPDARADIYSIGMIFHELLTGAPPHVGRRSLDILHAHLAHEVAPLDAHTSAIPEVLSNIVRKLCAKSPEERYQSVRGACVDLERCRADILMGRSVVFSLGVRDRGGRLRLCQSVYGRESAIAQLHALLVRVEQSHGALAIVSGPLGIGKTVFIDHALREFKSGVWRIDAAAKENDSIPGLSLLRRMVRNLLAFIDTKEESVRSAVRDAIHAAAGGMIGQWPELAADIDACFDTSYSTAKRMVEHGLQTGPERDALMGRILAAAAMVSPCLVWTIEDAQKLNGAEIDGLRQVLHAADKSKLLILLALRADGELPQAIVELKSEHVGLGRPFAEIALGPLPAAGLELMLADMLDKPAAEVSTLAGILARRCASIPLVVVKFLELIEHLGLLRYEPEGGWVWVSHEIDSVDIPADAAHALAETMRVKPARVRRLLALASCLGDEFELGELHEILGGDRSSLRMEIRSLVDDGMLCDLGQRFRFAHPFLAEKAIESLTRESLAEAHALVARMRLRLIPESQRPDRVLEIISHLNCVPDLLTDREREIAVALNHHAATSAVRQATAADADEYFHAAFRLLSAQDWVSMRKIAWDVSLGMAQVSLNRSSSVDFDSIVRLLKERADTVSEHVEVVKLEVQGSIQRGNNSEVWTQICRALRYLSHSLPDPVRLPMLVYKVWRARRILRQRSTHAVRVATTAAIPKNIWAKAELMFAMQRALRPVTCPESAWLVCELLEIYAKFGDLPGLAEVLASFAVIDSAVFPNRSEATKIAKLADDALLRGSRHAMSRVSARLMLASLTAWRGPLDTTISELEELSREAHTLGMTDAHQDALLQMATTCVYAGYPLERLKQMLEEGAFLNSSTWESSRARSLNLLRQLVASVRGEEHTVSIANLRRTLQDVYELHAEGDGVDLQSAAVAFLLPLFLLDDADGVSYVLEISRSYVQLRPGSYAKVICDLVQGLVLARKAKTIGGRGESRRTYRRVKALIADFERASENCSENYLIAIGLLKSVLAASRGDFAAQLLSLLHARDHAMRQHAWAQLAVIEYLRMEALQDLGLTGELARAVDSARNAFNVWGAQGLWQQLERTHSAFSLPNLTVSRVSRASHDSLVRPTYNKQALDAAAIVRVVQATVEDIGQVGAVSRVLGFAMRTAGADRALLLVAGESGFVLEAEAHAGSQDDCVYWSMDVESCGQMLPLSVVRYVRRSSTFVSQYESRPEPRFGSDPYLRQRLAAALHAVPVVRNGDTIGIIYLENSFVEYELSSQQKAMLEVLAVQAIVAWKGRQQVGQLREYQQQVVQVQREKVETITELRHELRGSRNDMQSLYRAIEHDLIRPSHGMLELIGKVSQATGSDLESGYLREVKLLSEHLMQASAGLVAQGEVPHLSMVERQREFALIDWIESVMQALRADAALDGIACGLELPPRCSDAITSGMPAWSARIVHSLLRWAAQRSPGGSLMVTLEPGERMLEIAVRDTGTALSADAIELLKQLPVGRVASRSGEGESAIGRLAWIARSIRAVGGDLTHEVCEPGGMRHRLRFAWRSTVGCRTTSPLSGVHFSLYSRSDVVRRHLMWSLTWLGANARSYGDINAMRDAIASDRVDAVLVDVAADSTHGIALLDDLQKNCFLPVVAVAQDEQVRAKLGRRPALMLHAARHELPRVIAEVTWGGFSWWSGSSELSQVVTLVFASSQRPRAIFELGRAVTQVAELDEYATGRELRILVDVSLPETLARELTIWVDRRYAAGERVQVIGWGDHFTCDNIVAWWDVLDRFLPLALPQESHLNGLRPATLASRDKAA